MTDTQLMRQALEALEKHAMQRTYAGGVFICNTAIALRERLAQPEPEPPVRELLIGAAAMAVASERQGKYQGASWVADAILESETLAIAKDERANP